MAEIPQNSFQGPLAPKFGLTDNARSSIPGGPKVDIPKKRNYGKLLPAGALALALLILPLTLQQLGKSQDVRQQASQPTPTIVLPTSTVASPTPTPLQVSLTPAPTVQPFISPTSLASPSVSLTPTR